MRRRFAVSLILAACLLEGCAGRPGQPSSAADAAPRTQPRLATRPFLAMPSSAEGEIPPLLSQTGAFADVRSLAPARGALPYDLAVAFWSDGAIKSRFVMIPAGQVRYSPTGDWVFPPGTVFVKTFELPDDATRPAARRRLETRLLVVDASGGVYGATYRWRDDLRDADLLPAAGLAADVTIRDARGTHRQPWVYPGREDCRTCHNAHTSGVLGPKARQLDFELRYPDGSTENQLRRWNRLGLFSSRLGEADMAGLVTLARLDDPRRSLQDRARSWLDANCAHCHRPGGTVANFDARFETPLERQRLIDGPVLIDQNVNRARVISARDPWRSVALLRVDTNDDLRMPPLARHSIDEQGVALLRGWILSLPGREALAPVAMTPEGGNFGGPVTVALSHPAAGAEIRYTLDGSAPGPGDARYEAPIRIDGAVVLRARAYKDGFTRSVISQQTYLVER